MGHVDDTVRGTLLAMDNPKAVGEIINIGNDEESSVLETARLIHELSGVKKPLRLKFIPMKKIFGTYEEIPRRVPDLSKAKRLLGYQPQVSYREGLKRIIDYYKSLL
jgi:UDP-glucose 4-epimerase